MSKYELRKGEDLDKALRRFRRKLKQNGVFDDVRKHEFYEKPSDRRKKDESAAKRRTYLSSLEE